MSKIVGLVAGVSKNGNDYLTLYCEKPLVAFGSGSAKGFTTESYYLNPSQWSSIKKTGIDKISELDIGVDVDIYYKGKDAYSGIALIVKNN